MQPELQKNSKSIRQQVKQAWDVLRRRPLMKLSALLLAVLFWGIVIGSDPTLTVEKVVTGVVAIQGADALRTKGYVVMEDLTSVPITVKMRVEIKRSDYERATAEAFSPRLDLSQQINAAGQQQIKITAGSTVYGKVLSFEPEYIDVHVEPYALSRRVPVVVEQTGQSAEPLWVDSPLPDPAYISVSGPKSIVDQIRRAVVRLPLNSLSADRPTDSISAPIELQDASGNPVSSPLLSVTNESVPVDSVIVSMQVYPMREVPIDAAGALVGMPAHGYTLGEVRVSPDTALVVAGADVLDTLDKLSVASPIDISGLSVSQSVTVSLKSLTNIVHASVQEVTVEVEIIPATHVHTYVSRPVTAYGLSPELSAKLSRPTMDVVISGEYQNVEPLTADAVHLFVDASGLSEGVHTLEVQCRVDGTEAFLFEPELPRVTVTVTKAQ